VLYANYTGFTRCCLISFHIFVCTFTVYLYVCLLRFHICGIRGCCYVLINFFSYLNFPFISYLSAGIILSLLVANRLGLVGAATLAFNFLFAFAVYFYSCLIRSLVSVVRGCHSLCFYIRIYDVLGFIQQ
jgi:hypothetical protein